MIKHVLIQNTQRILKLLVNTFELPFEQRNDYLDRMINLGILSLYPGEIVGPSCKFLEVFAKVMGSPELRTRIIKAHDPELARMLFCGGALIHFVDMIRDEELFHMINTMSRYINYPSMGINNFKNFMSWIKYYYK